MDYFQAQDSAQRHTVRLVLLFALAVLSLIIITNLLVMVLFGFGAGSEQGITLNGVLAQFDWQTFMTIGAMVSLVILGGSVYKTMALSAGGAVVAESLGGRRIDQGTTDRHERKILNVVEEMAIASGTPVPPVYLLDHEAGINAFAAGFTPADAVIGVTRGAIALLSRDELQGVVAHEFSHILHGDMRLNIRLIGILHGILLIGLIGYYLLRSMRGGRNKNAGAILGLGLGLMAIGFTGSLFGNLIKASVSRQREFLADASAVQFTRNQRGIAGALKKIGGHVSGSVLESVVAPSMSHAYFSNGVSTFVESMFATHPPLEQRIRRIDPQWDGRFPRVTHEVSEDSPPRDEGPSSARGRAVATAVAGVVIAEQILESVGNASPDHLDYAVALMQELPTTLHEAVHDPYAARAVIYCLLMARGDAAIQQRQLERLQGFADEGVYELVRRLLPTVQGLAIRFRLPLIEMALPTLRQLSEAQYHRFKENLSALMAADRRIDLFEWSLQRILYHYLEPQFVRTKPRRTRVATLSAVRGEIEVLLSMLVYACVPGDGESAAALASAERELGLSGLRLLPREQIAIARLDSAVDNLTLLKPLLTPRLLKGCLAVITQDQHYSPREMELMRSIGAALDCPLPPYLAS